VGGERVGVDAEGRDVDGDRAGRLGSVDEDEGPDGPGGADGGGDVEQRARRPRDV